MAAKKRAEKKVAKGSAKPKAGASVKRGATKAAKKAPSKKAPVKKTAPKKAAPQKAPAKAKTAALKKPIAKAPKVKPIQVMGKTKPSILRPGKPKPEGSKAPVKSAPKALKAAKSPAPAAKPSTTGSKTTGSKNTGSKQSTKPVLIKPSSTAASQAVAQSTRGLTKPGALGTGPVRLIPASTPSGRSLAPSSANRPGTDAGKSHSSDRPAAKSSKQGVTLVRRTTDRPAPAIPTPVLPIPVRPKAPTATIEERSATIEKRLAAQTEDFRKRYIDSFDMSWIYHDSALEGVVYTLEELRTGLTNVEVAQVPDSSLQPAADEIRRHKEAIEYVRDFGTKKRLPVTMDVIKKIYLILHPSEGDLKTVKYRKDIPQHRLYFHEYAAPDKIGYKVRQIVDWLNEPETKKTRNSLRIAARAHYDLLRVFPFQTDSGKVARLFMNLLLMRAGYPPSIIHSTERQRYYDALKGSANIVLAMVQESVENALSSVEKLLDEHDSKARAFVN